MVDPQLDDVHREALALDFSALDVPKDRFVVAGEAWAAQRAGRVDPAQFGIGKLWGAWFIGVNVIHDLAALNKQELLAWDVWGMGSRSERTLTESELQQYDQLAAVGTKPDEALSELRDLLASDERVRVPEQVWNVRQQRSEPVGA